MNDIKINVYDKKGEIVKTCTAKTASIKFGTVRAIMRLLQIDKIDDTSQMFSAVYGAWEQLINLLGDCFPDMKEEDWDNVPVAEVLEVLIEILKSSFADMKLIQGKNSKN